MNYKHIYDAIIERAKSRGLNKKLLDGYFEKHHIVPKCLGGSNEDDNLVLLTGREHYLCHYLLWKVNKDNRSLFYAYHKMVYQKRAYQERYFKISSKQYEILKDAHREMSSMIHKGKTLSAETRRKISIAQNNPSINNFGKKWSKETKEKMRQAKIGIPQTEEAIKNRSNACKKHVVILGVVYNSFYDACNEFCISRNTLRKRLLSEEYKDYFYENKIHNSNTTL